MIDHELLDRILRFHLVLDDHGRVAHLGPALGRLVPGALGAALAAIAETDDETVDLAAGAPSWSRRIVVLRFKDPELRIRGELLALDDDRWLFAGVLDPTDASRLRELGLTPADFAPCDLTLDFSMFQWTRDTQVRETRLALLQLRRSIDEGRLLRKQANTDELTGLATRNRFLQVVDEAIIDHRSTDATQIAVVTINIDRFKSINDLNGHPVGDRALIHVADHISDVLGEGATVARLGNDEFAVMIPGLLRGDEETMHSIVGLCDQVVGLNHEPVVIDGTRVPIRLSIGVALHEEQVSAGELLRHADIAMAAARDSIDGPIGVFDPHTQRDYELRRLLTDDLETAIDERAIELVFQPIVDLSTRKAIKYEVLSRWTHPIHGPVSPGLFFELAERCHLAQKLDRYIIHRALHVAAERLSVRGEVPMLSVNVSALSLNDSLVDFLQATLQEMHYPANRLSVEVTETSSVRDMTRTGRVLNKLDALGIVVSLDDFGTGFSSLTYLHQLPIGALKIDRSFVADMLTSRKALELVRSILGVARSLDLPVVAEGIETVEQCVMLQNLGCSQGQGFYFARPEPAEATAVTIGHVLPVSRTRAEAAEATATRRMPSPALRLARDPSLA
ncbi:MAG: bifunctional diguanylate cyclase/phosphodiesterase [Actinomycetota bacterium]